MWPMLCGTDVIHAVGMSDTGHLDDPEAAAGVPAR